MVWPKTKDGDDDSSPAADGPSPASDSEPSSNEPSSQDSGLSTTTSTSTYPPFPQQAPVLLAYNSSNDTASSPPPANSYEDYYYSIPSAQPRTHHYYPRITHSISATESSTQLPSPPDSDFILSPTPPEQGQQQAPGGPLPQRGGQLFHDSFDHARSASSRLNPPARQYPGLSTSKNDAETFIDDDEDDAALNSILDGVGKMHITMGRDNSGRWRIRRTGDTLD